MAPDMSVAGIPAEGRLELVKGGSNVVIIVTYNTEFVTAIAE